MENKCDNYSYEGYDKEIRKQNNFEISLQYKFLPFQVALQGLLFAGFINIEIHKTPELYLYGMIIIIVGIICALSSIATYFNSEAKIKRNMYFWNGYLKRVDKTYFDFPPVWGAANDKEIVPKELYDYWEPYRFSCFHKLCGHFIFHKTIPFVFLFAWIGILVIYCLNH